MLIVSIHEAKTQLSKLLSLVERGEEVVIVRNGRPVAQIVRAQVMKKPRLGTMKGEISWKEGWDKPLSAEEANAFWDSRW